MNTKNSSQPISRRNMLRTSGALAASGVVLAACGSSSPIVTRIGESPTTVKLTDVPVTDLALLRRIAPLGIGKGEFQADRFTAEEGAACLESGRADTLPANSNALGITRRSTGPAARSTRSPSLSTT